MKITDWFLVENKEFSALALAARDAAQERFPDADLKEIKEYVCACFRVVLNKAEKEGK